MQEKEPPLGDDPLRVDSSDSNLSIAEERDTISLT